MLTQRNPWLLCFLYRTRFHPGHLQRSRMLHGEFPAEAEDVFVVECLPSLRGAFPRPMLFLVPPAPVPPPATCPPLLPPLPYPRN